MKVIGHFNNINNKNITCDDDALHENKNHNINSIGEHDSFESESDVGSVGIIGTGGVSAYSVDASSLNEMNASNSLTTTAANPYAGSMASITSEQRLCQLYNSQQHSDYIISDYMEKIATRISLLETELKFAWRALDLLSGEYGKIWARLEKLEKISTEQQSVVSNLMGLIALKKEHQQQQQLNQNHQHGAEYETHLDFIDNDAVDQQRPLFDYLLRDEHLLMSNLVEAEQQAILLNNSAAALLHDINMEGTSKHYNNLLQELKNDTLDALDAVRMDSELDALGKVLQQQTSLTYDEGAIVADSVHFKETKPGNMMYSLGRQENLQLSDCFDVGDGVNHVLSKLVKHGELSGSLSPLSNVQQRKCHQVAAAITAAKLARNKLYSDSELLLYEQQQMQANDAKSELLQQFRNSRQILEKLVPGDNNACSDRLQHYTRTASGSVLSLPFVYGGIFGTTRKLADATLQKAHSLAHIRPQIFSDLSGEMASNLYENNEGSVSVDNIYDIDMPLSDFVEQVKFFRQAASKHGEGGQLVVPIEDTGGTCNRTLLNIGNNSEMNEEFYKKLNEAYRDNSLTTEISNVERLLQQSEATHEHVLGVLGAHTNSTLDMIREDNEEAPEGIVRGIGCMMDIAASDSSQLIPTTITTNLTTTAAEPTTTKSVTKKIKESKKQKKKKHYKDEMEMLNNLKSALAQTAVDENINKKTPKYSNGFFSSANATGPPNVGDRRSTASSSEEEYNVIGTQFDGQDYFFSQLNEDKTVVLDSTGEILLMEINKIQDLQVLSAAQILKLRQLVKNDIAFFENIYQVNNNLLLLLLNPVTIAEEMRAFGNDKHRKFEVVMKKLERNIDTLKKLVGNSFDDYKRKYLTDAELTLMKAAGELTCDKIETANKTPKKYLKTKRGAMKQSKIPLDYNAEDTDFTHITDKKDKLLESRIPLENDISVKSKTNNNAHFDYSAQLLRNNSNLDEQLKILETQEHEMHLKKFHDPTKNAGSGNKGVDGNSSTDLHQPYTSYLNTDNYLVDMDAEFERMILRTSTSNMNNIARENRISQPVGRATSATNLYSNDEYIKSLKRSLERHNSMLFLLHLQHPDHQHKTNAYQDVLAMDIDGILLAGVGGKQSPPPPAPNDAQSDVPHKLSEAEVAAVDISISSMPALNPFHQQAQMAGYGSAHLQIHHAGGSPKQTKSDSGLSSMSGLSSWEKSPNSPVYCGSSAVVSIADICNPFLNSYQGINMDMQLLMSKTISMNNSNNSNLDNSGLITDLDGSLDLGINITNVHLNVENSDKKLVTTTHAITIQTTCSIIPTIINSTIATFSNTLDKIKQQNHLQQLLTSQFQHQSYQQKQQPELHKQQQKHPPQQTEKDYMLSEENLNYIRELSKNMPICSVYENKSIFNILKDDTLDDNIRTVDEMLEWDNQQQTQKQQPNISSTTIRSVDSNRRIPDLLRTPVYEALSTGSRNSSTSSYEETEIDRVALRESQTRKQHLTDHLVYYPTFNGITDYNSSQNLDYLGKSNFEYRRQFQHQQLQQRQHYLDSRCVNVLGYADTLSSPIEPPRKAPQHQQQHWLQTHRPASVATYELYNHQMQERNNLTGTLAYALQRMPSNSNQSIDTELPMFIDPNTAYFSVTPRDGATAQGIMVSSASAAAIGLDGGISTLSTSVNSSAVAGQSIFHKPPKVWNRLTNFLPESFKLKRSPTYGRSRSLPTGYDNEMHGNNIKVRGQAGSYPSVAGHITPKMPNSHIKPNGRDVSEFMVYKMTASTMSTGGQQRRIKHLGGSFDFSKRFHKLPLQLMQRATHPGARAVVSTSTSSATADTGLAGGTSIKKAMVGKGHKTRSKFSVTVNNFMQKARTYRRRKFVTHGRSGVEMGVAVANVSDTEADLPSFTSSDNEDLIANELEELSAVATEERTFGEHKVQAFDEYKTLLPKRHKQHIKLLQQKQLVQEELNVKLLRKKIHSGKDDREEDYEEDVPSFGEIGEFIGISNNGEEQGRHQDNEIDEDIDAIAMSMFPQICQLNPKESSTSNIEKEVTASQSPLALHLDQTMTNDRSNIFPVMSDIRRQQQDQGKVLKETKNTTFTPATTKEPVSDSRLLPKPMMLYKSASICVDNEECDYSGRGMTVKPQMQPVSIISSECNKAPYLFITKINNDFEDTNMNTMPDMEYKLNGHGQRSLSTQQSLDVPAAALHEEDDNRSQHSYRTLSSSRRQSTEDSIDTDDEYFCYELRQLEELEQQRKAEIEPVTFEANHSVDNAQLFSQIDQLAISSTTGYHDDRERDFLSDEYAPGENVKQVMSEVLKELKYVVKQLPAIDDAMLETAIKATTKPQHSHGRSSTKSSISTSERVTKVADIHSAWQDIKGDELQLNSSDADAEEYACVDAASSDALEETNTFHAIKSIEDPVPQDFEKCQQHQQRQFTQQTHNLIGSERIGPHKRFRKRRDRRRTNDSCFDNEASQELHHSTSSSYSSEEDAASATKRYKEKTKSALRRGSSSSDKQKRVYVTQVMSHEPEFHSEPIQLIETMQSSIDIGVVAADENLDDEESKNLSMSSGATLGPDTPAELSEELEGDQRVFKTAPSYQAFRDNQGRTEIVTENRQLKARETNIPISAQIDFKNISAPANNNAELDLIQAEKEREVQKQPAKLSIRFLSHDSSVEGSQVTNAAVLGSSKWKLLKTLKERKIEEKNNQEKIKDDELTKDREKNGNGSGDIGIRGSGHPGDNPFYSNIDSMPDIRPRRKSIPLVSELVSS
ncbi:uncharacterized protein LOC129250678 [Anastrepha obliqua]|uniref:uncharacterized protein LOC129250678 n=1 Tax=Anastrepha obliqua TaxID=95512 RepID=UPI00240A4A1F|nr:uncharacterized protein LOC129250678 [Anastrepha obliqua]